MRKNLMEEENNAKYDPRIRRAKLKPHEGTSFKKIIAVVSGKGGVGKSFVTSLLAVSLMNKGHKVSIMDADVTGPSIAKTFGKDTYTCMGDKNAIYPAETERGLTLISSNNLLDDPTTPIVWRGSLISSLVAQMFTEIVYGEKEFLLIDMPPGTGDVPLTVFQQLPIDGIVIVTSPQDLVSEVVLKSIKMAKMMNVSILGVVENMAYLKCPHCGEKINLFGKDNVQELLNNSDIPLLDRLGIDSSITALIDEGKIEEYKGNDLENTVGAVEALIK